MTLPTCVPRWATPRTDRPTDGAEVAAFARALGRPLTPWQRHVADLTGERDPHTGLPAYSRVVLIVPRRAGKSLLMLARGLATIRTPRRRAFYTSAHRENAARMWRDDWFPTIEASPLRAYTRITRGNGQESVRMSAGLGGSTLRLVAATGNAIRGAAANLVVIDEARELSPDVGENLEAAVFPTQATGAGGQTWIVSNAGTAESVWLARWRDLGRAAADEGRTERLAYVEYAAPDDADPADEATWWAAHPGLGHHVNLDALRADAEVMTPDAFACEYLGRWPTSLVDTAMLDAWAAAATDRAAVADPVAFAVELDEDRTTATVVVAGTGPAGFAVELVESRPHGTWLVPRLVDLVERWSPLALCWDAGGPAGALTLDMAEVSTRLVPMGTRDVAAAAGWFHDAVLAGAVSHRPDPVLDAGIDAARRRRAGGAWLFDRRQPGAGPVVAASMALWAVREAVGRVPSVA